MSKSNTKRIDLFFELYERDTIPTSLKGIFSTKKKQIFANSEYDPKTLLEEKKVHSIFFVPDYFYPEIDLQLFKVKKVKQFFKGYAIFLDGYKHVDEYLKHRFRSNAKTIKKRVRRLEACFQVRTEMFYGSIDEALYNSLMAMLQQMLVRRFDQRNDVSQSLLNWESFKKLFLPLINEKRASLFVIYENDKPIVISLSHHFEGHLFSAISSYDIDYSKFSPGSIEIYKKLEWCIANGHMLYEMGMGDLTYKREWCDHIYNFEQHIIYRKNNIGATLAAHVEYAKVTFKEWVYKVAYVRYKKFKAGRKKEIPSDIQIEIADLEFEKKEISFPKIDHNSKEYAYLKNIVYDFLYSRIEKLSDVTVFEASKIPHTFLIQGKSNLQKVILTKKNELL